MLGVQYKQYEQNEVYAADISSVVTFLNSVKDSQNLQKEDIRTNSRTLTKRHDFKYSGSVFRSPF